MPPRDSSASANKHKMDSVYVIGQVDGMRRSPSKWWFARSRAQNKTKNTCAQEVQAARTVSMSSNGVMT